MYPSCRRERGQRSASGFFPRLGLGVHGTLNFILFILFFMFIYIIFIIYYLYITLYIPEKEEIGLTY